jgi:hypothetical protein
MPGACVFWFTAILPGPIAGEHVHTVLADEHAVFNQDFTDGGPAIVASLAGSDGELDAEARLSIGPAALQDAGIEMHLAGVFEFE